MNTVRLSELRPGAYINLDGEIITKEQAEQLIVEGKRPTLYTVSDEWITESLLAASKELKEGKEVSDTYTAPDENALRVLYSPIKYCPVCGINYSGIKRNYGKEYCCSTRNHHGTRIGLAEYPFESVKLVSSSYEDGGHFQGDVGEVIDIKSATLKSGHTEIDIRVKWLNGAEECWIGAEDFVAI